MLTTVVLRVYVSHVSRMSLNGIVHSKSLIKFVVCEMLQQTKAKAMPFSAQTSYRAATSSLSWLYVSKSTMHINNGITTRINISIYISVINTYDLQRPPLAQLK